jgi:hypothetical protein|tara:strand:+ start:1362 stop:1754 length:393 start_codon:yes stop_codon:yes gene_type:complete
MADILRAIRQLDSNAEVVVYGTPTNEAEYQAQVKFKSGVDANGYATFKETQDFTWEQVQGQFTSAEFNEALEKLREERTMKLAETDFYGNSDVTMSNAMATYRQELRDITNGLTTKEEVEAVVFPTKPSE